MKRDGEEARGVTAGVYFLQAQGSGMIKIGFSGNISERIKSLSTASPEPLRLLGAIAGPIELERALHRGFARYRVNGEWFRPAEPLLALAEISARAWRPSPAWQPPTQAEHRRGGKLSGVPEPIKDLALPSVATQFEFGSSDAPSTFQEMAESAFDERFTGWQPICRFCWGEVRHDCEKLFLEHEPGCLLMLAAANSTRDETRKLLLSEDCEACENEGKLSNDIAVMAYG